MDGIVIKKMKVSWFFPEKAVNYLILSFTISLVVYTMNTYVCLLKT